MMGAMSDGDAFEALYARGVTDGLPVIPPTAERVAAAVAASGRPADELVGLVAPQHGRATVQKIAINAVMAGCRPEYLPVVIAGVRAICDPAFALEGVSGTTDAVAPLLIVNGPVRHALDINAGVGVFGPGWRANATIGRAVRLVWANVGGARPGAISMSTFGQSGRYTYCIGEHEEASPWAPLHVEHGFAPGDSTVAALAAEAPQVVVDARSRTAREVLTTVARSGEVIASHAVGDLGDTLLVIGPEHVRTIAADRWSKADVRTFVWERTRAEVDGRASPSSARRRTSGSWWPAAPPGASRPGCRAGRSAGRPRAWSCTALTRPPPPHSLAACPRQRSRSTTC
jgi:hypothetical protein